jgi:cobyrinic acid a,c-diamide synthase
VENQDLETFIETAALAVARETVLDRILGFAGQLVDDSVIRESLPPLGQRIAIARDTAFAFAYPHLMHQWRRSGASLTFFSPLANEPPAAGSDAVFLPGGYPELYAARLAANADFLDSLRKFKGLIYGECGGYMVLGDALVDGTGTSHAMAGLLPVVTSFASRKLHLGYRQLVPEPGAPWTSPLRGHEFHYSSIVHEGTADRLFTARDAAGRKLAPMGLRRGRVMGSYAHVICEAF